MCASTKSTIGDQCYTLAQAGTNDCRSRFQHFRHAGRSSWTNTPDYDDISWLDPSALDTRNQFKLAIKYSRRSFKSFTFLTTDLCHTSFFRKISVEDLQVT